MIKAKKSLGQNFLIDRNIIEKITTVVDIKEKIVLEIGPGTGNLTSSLITKNPKKISKNQNNQQQHFQFSHITIYTVYGSEIVSIYIPRIYRLEDMLDHIGV